jgi:hypothetical protein
MRTTLEMLRLFRLLARPRRNVVANRRVSTVQHGRWNMVDPIVFLTLLV